MNEKELLEVLTPISEIKHRNDIMELQQIIHEAIMNLDDLSIFLKRGKEKDE